MYNSKCTIHYINVYKYIKFFEKQWIRNKYTEYRWQRQVVTAESRLSIRCSYGVMNSLCLLKWGFLGREQAKIGAETSQELFEGAWCAIEDKTCASGLDNQGDEGEKKPSKSRVPFAF